MNHCLHQGMRHRESITWYAHKIIRTIYTTNLETIWFYFKFFAKNVVTVAES